MTEENLKQIECWVKEYKINLRYICPYFDKETIASMALCYRNKIIEKITCDLKDVEEYELRVRQHLLNEWLVRNY